MLWYKRSLTVRKYLVILVLEYKIDVKDLTKKEVKIIKLYCNIVGYQGFADKHEYLNKHAEEEQQNTGTKNIRQINKPKEKIKKLKN